MSRLPIVALLSFLSFPCLAETLTEQFSRMDLNKDGFLSEREFVQGMTQTQPDLTESEEETSLSFAEKEKLIDEAVTESKKMLPFKVDQETTWTDVYGRDSAIHYVYRIETDIGPVPAEQMLMLRQMMEAQICPKVQPAMCGVAKDSLLSKGISLMTHYNDKNGNLLAECRFTFSDCR